MRESSKVIAFVHKAIVGIKSAETANDVDSHAIVYNASALTKSVFFANIEIIPLPAHTMPFSERNYQAHLKYCRKH